MRRTALILAVAAMSTAPPASASASQRLTFRQARAAIHHAWGDGRVEGVERIEIAGCRRRSATRVTCRYRVLLLVSWTTTTRTATRTLTTREWVRFRDAVHLDRRGRVHDDTLSGGLVLRV